MRNLQKKFSKSKDKGSLEWRSSRRNKSQSKRIVNKTGFSRLLNPNFFKALLAVVSVGLVVNFATGSQAAPSSAILQSFPTVSTTELGGLVFRDFNANGILDSQEPGFTSILNNDTITVEAYDDSNTVVATTTTNSDGTYVLTGLTAGTEYRIELSGLPSFLQAGASHGSGGSESTVAFATAGDNDVLMTVNTPGDFCQSVDQLELAIPCYVQGDPLGGGSAETLDAFATFDYNGTAVDQHIMNNEIGANYGVAYDPVLDQFYSASFIKRYSGFGPLGIGGIYTVDPNNGDVGTLTTVGGLTDVPRVGLNAEADRPSNDDDAFAAVGMMGLGDIDFDAETRTLYVMNLESRQIETISIAYDGTATPGAPIVLTDPGCTNGEFRPFAIEIKDGKIYVGSTCDASSGTTADLAFVVQEYDGANVAEIARYTDLAGMREFHTHNPNNGQHQPAEWQVWSNDSNAIETYNPPAFGLGAVIEYHQPMLSDIEFDNDGSLILGVADRTAHQYGVRNLRVGFTNPVGGGVRTVSSAGDVLRMCFDNAGSTYVAEGNTGCVRNSGNGVDATGSDIPEYYEGDFYTGSTGVSHFETAQGALFQVPGREEFVQNAADPSDYNSGGVTYLSNTTGQKVNDFELFNSGAFPALRRTNETFSKGAGLGDIEAACAAAPIEIGNRVWVDTDGDGVQDPSESTLAGVEVELLDDNGDVVATAVTDASGNYIFTSWDYDHPGAWASTDADPDTADAEGIVPGGVLTNSDYTIRIDMTQTVITDNNYTLTTADSGNGSNPDLNDSDGTTSGDYAVYSFTTGNAGHNDHTVDFGVNPGTPPLTMRLGNQVWFDADNDAIRDAGEDPIEGVTMALYADVDGDGIFEPGGDDGAVLATTLTDANGKYWFEGLDPGEYFVAIPDTNTSVTVDSNTYDLNDLINSTAQGLTNHDAGNYEPADNDVDNDDQGSDASGLSSPAGFITDSGVIELTEDGEPTAETQPGGAAGADETEANAQTGSDTPDDNNSNLTIDFGFFELPDVAVDKLVDADGDASYTNIEIVDTPGINGNPDPSVFTYIITAENQATAVAATNVVLTDIIPPGVTVTATTPAITGLPITGAAGTGSPLVWNVGTIAAGDSEVLIVTANVSSGINLTNFANGFDADGSSQNVAQITAMTEDDTDSEVNNGDTADYGGSTTGFDAGASQDDEDDARVSIPPALGNFVWRDDDGDGEQDTAEPGIGGVTVTLYEDDDGTPGPSAGDTVVRFVTTASDGSYFFGNLTSGVDYYVGFDHGSASLANFEPTTQDSVADGVDSDGDTTTGFTGIYNLAPAEVNDTVDMGYTPRPSLGNYVWQDNNGDGVQDTGEPGIEDVTVNLYIDEDGSGGLSPGDTLVESQDTDADGLYLFEGLTAGVDYFVEFDHSTVPAGLFPTSQDTGNDDTDDSDGDTTTGVTGIYNLGPNEQDLTVDMGYVPLFSIGNRVWMDDGTGAATLDDGQQQASEDGIGGVDLRLLDSSGNPVDTDPNTAGVQEYTVTTDPDGYYRFDNLIAGDYIVEVIGSTLPTNVISSTGQSTSNTPDQQDHGSDTAVGGNYRSHTVTLGTTAGTQPEDESDITTGQGAESPHGDPSSNLAIDFGFVPYGDVSVVKSVTPGTYIIGQTTPVTWTVEVTNEGPSDAAGITVDDTAPTGLTFTSWTCAITTPGTGSLTESCENASGTGDISETVDLNVGGVATYTIDTEVDSTQSSPFTNVVDVALPDTVAQDANNNEQDQDMASINPQGPDLALRKILGASQSRNVSAGDDVTFTIEVYNQGQVDAYNIGLIDYLPAGLSLSSADSNGWVASGANATNTIAGPLAVGGSVSIDIVTTLDSDVPSSSSLENFAEITAFEDSLGNVLSDVDSTPDSNPGDTLDDNEIDDSGLSDEDDHDVAGITIEAQLSTTGSTAYLPVVVGSVVALSAILVAVGIRFAPARIRSDRQ